ncbi:MAG: substrate-binding domain-containing protein, partial [Thermocrispum sp.]
GPGKENVDAVHRVGVDGFVVYSVPDDDPHLAAVLQRPVPTVIIDQPVIDDVDRVGPDDTAAMSSLAYHLIELGHRDIGVLCMRLSRERRNGFVSQVRQQQAHYHVQRARLAALADAFHAVGVDWSTVPVVERFEHTMDEGASAARQLLDTNPQVTALICTSDILALGALAEATRRGLQVPSDLTVTGFDDVADAQRAGLTTVHQPVRDKGRSAGKLLLDPARRIGFAAVTAEIITLDTELRVGRTSAPPRTSEQRWFGP